MLPFSQSPFLTEDLSPPARGGSLREKLEPLFGEVSPAVRQLLEQAVYQDRIDRGEIAAPQIVQQEAPFLREEAPFLDQEQPAHRYVREAEEEEEDEIEPPVADEESYALEFEHFADPPWGELEHYGELGLEVFTEEEAISDAADAIRRGVAAVTPILGATAQEIAEREVIAALIKAGTRDPSKAANEVFWLRHPDKRGQKIDKTKEPALAEEWSEIYKHIALPELLSGPRHGPMHSPPGTPVPPQLLDLPQGAVISPLAIAPYGLRKQKAKMKQVSQIVVHMTSRGPANKSAKKGYKRPAIDFAADYYVNGSGGYPHYVVDFNGTLYATADERFSAGHAGWVHKGGAKHFTGGWTAPKWWSDVWSSVAKTPLNLLPKGAKSPNSQSIGVELLILPDLSYTEAQYRALAHLVRDVQARHSLTISSAPSKQLLGHEDYGPVTGEGGRADNNGGWDPGAHRKNPYFSWKKLWDEMQKI